MKLNTNIIRQILKLFLFVNLALFATACTAEDVVFQQLPVIESPLPQSTSLPSLFENQRLIDNRWRLLSFVLEGDPLNYGSIEPVHIRFFPEGILMLNTHECNGAGLYVTPVPDNTFRVGGGEATAVDCGEERNAQYDSLLAGIDILTTYEIRGDLVLLTSKTVTATLAVDNR